MSGVSQLEDFDKVVDKLIARIKDWHGLEPTKFGKLQIYGPLDVQKDKDSDSSQILDNYLFSDILIMAREDPETKDYTLKGSVLSKHLDEVAPDPHPEKYILDLVLSVSEPPHLYLGFEDSAHLEKWKKALLSVRE